MSRLIDWLELWLGTLEFYLVKIIPCLALAFLLYIWIYVIETITK